MRVTNAEYSLYTFDASMALIGGYAALIWQVLSILLSWFQDFSYKNELALALYTREKKHKQNWLFFGLMTKVIGAFD